MKKVRCGERYSGYIILAKESKILSEESTNLAETQCSFCLAKLFTLALLETKQVCTRRVAERGESENKRGKTLQQRPQRTDSAQRFCLRQEGEKTQTAFRKTPHIKNTARRYVKKKKKVVPDAA